jgi:hypothetical protein
LSKATIVPPEHVSRRAIVTHLAGESASETDPPLNCVSDRLMPLGAGPRRSCVPRRGSVLDADGGSIVDADSQWEGGAPCVC